MQWLLVLVFVASVSLGAFAAPKDECVPKPGENVTAAWDCCKVSEFLPNNTWKKVDECAEKHAPKAGEKISKEEEKTAVACTAECVMRENGLLGDDKRPDKAGILKALSNLSDDKDLMTGITLAIDKCISSLPSFDSSLECPGGAMAFELENCLLRETLLNCPKEMWTDSPDCKAYKAKFSRCAKVLTKGES